MSGRPVTVLGVAELSDDDDAAASDLPLDQRASLCCAPTLPPSAPPSPDASDDEQTPPHVDVRLTGAQFKRFNVLVQLSAMREAALLNNFELRPLHERVLGGRSPAGAWTPRWAMEYQMPRAALTHHFDAQNLFANKIDAQQALTPRKKGGTLGRLRRARAATDARTARLELSKQQIKTLNSETERIVNELSERVEIFTALLCEIASITDKEQVTSVATLGELFLVDCTVTQHPNLKALGMPDNRLLIEQARGAVWSFACAAAAEARYRLIDAESRRDAVLHKLGVWFAKTFGSEAAEGATPVAWNLSEDSHSELPAGMIVARRNDRLMRETPLLMLGVLLQLEWHAKANALLRCWWRDCV